MQHIPQIVNQIRILGIWMPRRHLELFVMSIEWYLSVQCLVEGDSFIGECSCHEGLCLVHSGIGMGGACQVASKLM